MFKILVGDEKIVVEAQHVDAAAKSLSRLLPDARVVVTKFDYDKAVYLGGRRLTYVDFRDMDIDYDLLKQTYMWDADCGKWI